MQLALTRARNNKRSTHGPFLCVALCKGKGVSVRLCMFRMIRSGEHLLEKEYPRGLEGKGRRVKKRGSPVHVAPACAGSGEGSDHLGLFVRSLSLHFCKRLVPGLEPVTSWSQGSSFTTAPRLPFIIHNYLHSKFPKNINRFCLANSHKDSAKTGEKVSQISNQKSFVTFIQSMLICMNVGSFS